METLSDGNCAFNAFALGIRDLVINHQFTAIPEAFLQVAQPDGNNWNDSNAFISWINLQQDLVLLQKTLAPVLRRLSNNYLRENYQHGNLDDDFEMAMGDYYDYRLQQNNPDNTYRFFPFVQTKITELDLEEIGREAFIQQMNQWWKDKGGRKAYLEYMSQPATSASDRARWGSQVELGALAFIFKIGLVFQRDQQGPQQCGFSHGFIPKMDIPKTLDLNTLHRRGVLEKIYDSWGFSRNFNERIAEVPHAAALIAKFKQYQTQALSLETWLEGIPKHEHEAIKNALEKRGALRGEYAMHDAATGDPPESPNQALIIGLISKLSEEERVFLQKYYQVNSVVIMVYLNGIHWSFRSRSSSSFDKWVEMERSKQKQQSNAILFRSNPSKSCNASGVKSSLHGTIYQLNILMLMSNRAHQKGYQFKLATEMDAAEKFDDAVIGLSKDGKGIVYHYVQAKHKQEDSFTLTDLLFYNESDGDFSLLKYFISYRKIKGKKEFEDGEMGDVIIYTNAKLESPNKCIKSVKDLLDPCEPNLLLKTSSKSTRTNFYRFDKSKNLSLTQNKTERSELYSLLKKGNTLRQLADVMLKRLDRIGKGNQFDLTDPLLKKYHLAIAIHIIRIETVKEGKKETKQGTFKAEFLEGKTGNDALKELLQIFVIEKGQSFVDGLKKKKFKCSGNFGNQKDLDYLEIADDIVTDQEIEAFFDHLVIAVEQPNELALFDIVKQELGIAFNLLDSEIMANRFQKDMLDWLKEKQGRFLTHEEAEAFFKQANQFLAHYMLMGPTIEYGEQVKRSQIAFKKPFDIDSILNSSEKITNIRCHDTWMMAIKIYGSLRSKKEYKAEDSFIFLRIQTAIHLQERLLQEVHGKSRLIILEINQGFNHKDFIDFLNALLAKLISVRSTQHFVLLTSKAIKLEEVDSCFRFDELDDSEDGFGDLTEETQKHLLDKKVNFQGQDMTVSKLFNEDKAWIDSTAMQLLINTESFSVDFPRVTLSNLHDFDEAYYLKRTCVRKKTIDEKYLMKEDGSGVIFVVTDDEDFIRQYSLKNARDWLSTRKDAQEEQEEKHHRFYARETESSSKKKYSKNDQHVIFFKLCNSFKKENVHWFSYKDGGLTWFKTKGSLNNIRKHIVGKRHQCSQDRFNFRLSIIAAEPGMGKTTAATSMAEGIARLPEILTLRVDLNQCKKLINQLTFDHPTSFIQFFSRIYDLTLLERYYLNHKVGLVEPKLHIYFDGFDEIDPDQQDKICLLLKCLSRTRVHLTVTTRRHKTEQLEDTLSIIAHSLKSITLKDQKRYLNRYWRSTLTREGIHDGKEKIARFVNAAVSALANSDHSFMGIPLQLRMVAEAFEDKMKTFCSCLNDILEIKTFDRIFLYKSIVEKKISIYLAAKLNIVDRMPSGLKASLQATILSTHYYLAFQLLFPKHAFLKRIRSTALLTQDDLNAIGLVEIRQQENQFIHRTYAEYLVACQLVTMLNRINVTNSTAEYFIDFIITQIFLEKNKVICLFIEDMVKVDEKGILLDKWNYICNLKIPCSTVGEDRILINDIFIDEEVEDDGCKIEQIDQQFKLWFDALNKYNSSSENHYCDIKSSLDDLITFSLENDLTFHQIQSTIQLIYEISHKKGNSAIIKKCVFDNLFQLSYQYIRKAFAPMKHPKYDLKLLENFTQISPDVYARSSYVTASDKEKIKVVYYDFLKQVTIFKLLDQFLIDDSSIKTIEDCLKNMDIVSLNIAEQNDKFKEIIAQVMYLQIMYQAQKKRILKQDLLKKIVGIYNLLFRNGIAKPYTSFFERLMCSLPQEEKCSINWLRFALAKKNHLDALKKVQSSFLSVCYKPKIDKINLEKLSSAKIFYLRHSDIVFNKDQLTCLMRNKEIMWNCIDDYCHLLLKIDYKDLNEVIAFSINHWDENLSPTLLKQAKQAFPKIQLTKIQVQQLYSNKSFGWLERTGAELVLHYQLFSTEMAEFFLKQIDALDGGWRATYVHKITNEMLLPLLHLDDLSEAKSIDAFALIEAMRCFFQRQSAISLDVKQLLNLLDLFHHSFNSNSLSIFQDYLVSTLSYFIRSMKVMVFSYHHRLVIVDNVGRLTYDMAMESHSTEVLQKIRDSLGESESQSHNKKPHIALKTCYNQMQNDSTYVIQRAFWRFHFYRKLTERRTDLLLNQNLQQVIIADTKRPTPKLPEYVRSITENRLHDAMQILRDREQQCVSYNPAEERYRFFKSATDITVDDIETAGVVSRPDIDVDMAICDDSVDSRHHQTSNARVIYY